MRLHYFPYFFFFLTLILSQKGRNRFMTCPTSISKPSLGHVFHYFFLNFESMRHKIWNGHHYFSDKLFSWVLKCTLTVNVVFHKIPRQGKIGGNFKLFQFLSLSFSRLHVVGIDFDSEGERNYRSG